jgi:aminoglycoside phosphotransferase (APT) family kinase protein
MREASGGPATAPGAVKIAEGREAEIFAWGEGRVLRLYRDPACGERADRELLALEAVREALPCAPAPHGRMEWNGRPGILMERLAGSAVLPEIQRRPWRVWSLATLTGRVHAELNALRGPASLPKLRPELRRRIEGAASLPEPLRTSALEVLDRLPDGDALCHGDFHPDNVLLCPGGPAVIDWPNATRGDPCADFARTTVMLRAGALPPGAPRLIRWAQGTGRGLFVRAYAAGYAGARRYDEVTFQRWQLVRAVDRFADGIPEERAGLEREAQRLRRGL